MLGARCNSTTRDDDAVFFIIFQNFIHIHASVPCIELIFIIEHEKFSISLMRSKKYKSRKCSKIYWVAIESKCLSTGTEKKTEVSKMFHNLIYVNFLSSSTFNILNIMLHLFPMLSMHRTLAAQFFFARSPEWNLRWWVSWLRQFSIVYVPLFYVNKFIKFKFPLSINIFFRQLERQWTHTTQIELLMARCIWRSRDAEQ